MDGCERFTRVPSPDVGEIEAEIARPADVVPHLMSRRHDDEVQLYAFDVLALEGNDLRKLLLHLRKGNLARLQGPRPDGIFVSDFEQGEIGPDLFRKAYEFGLGPVFKRRESVYRE